MDVVVPKLMDTGFAVKSYPENVDVELDYASIVQQFLTGEVSKLPWKGARKAGGFIYILRAKRGRVAGTRKISMQSHKIYEDGTRGPRILLWERTNGKQTR